MVKCWQCNCDMTFRPLNKSEIILVCSDENCAFKSLPIKLDPEYKPTEIIPLPEIVAIKEFQVDITKKVDENTKLMSSLERINTDEKYDYVFEPELSVPQLILPRNGDLNEFSIYCLDFSNRMDKEIPFKEEDLKIWRERITNDEILSNRIKEKLLELIDPPISYFRCSLLGFSFLILENIKKMTVEDFHSFQIISIAGESEEVFRFPNFPKQTTPEIIFNFIDSMQMRRKDYKSNELLNYRDFSLTIQTCSELMVEIRDIFHDVTIQVFLIIIGSHKSLEKKPMNPIKEIRDQIEAFSPFTFNIIHLNQNAPNKALKQISRRFNGDFSEEPTFKGLLNTIVFEKIQTDIPLEYKEEDILSIPKRISKKKLEVSRQTPLVPVKSEVKVDKKALEQKTTQDIEDDFIRQKDEKVEDWEKEVISFSIKNEADGILEKIIKDVKEE